GGFQDLLQPPSLTYRPGGATARRCAAAPGREPTNLSMAISLSRPVPNTDSCLIPKKTKIPAARQGGRHIGRLAMPKCRSNGRGVSVRTDETAVRSACAWHGKVAKCRKTSGIRNSPGTPASCPRQPSARAGARQTQRLRQPRQTQQETLWAGSRQLN